MDKKVLLGVLRDGEDFVGENTFISKRSFILTSIEVDFLSKALHDQ